MNASDDYRAKLLNEIQGDDTESSGEDDPIQELSGDEEKIQRLIEALRDPSVPTSAKKSSLAQLSVISIFSSVLRRKMPDYVNALRGLIEDADGSLRVQACGTLSVMKDEVVQQRLQADLESEKPETERIVPTHQAIGMLGFDEKALDYGVLKRIVQNPPSGESLVAAIRHLPASADSYELLSKVLENDSNPLAARALVPDRISQIDPRGFLALVARLLERRKQVVDLAPYLARAVGEIEARSEERGDFTESVAMSDSAGDLADEIAKAKSSFADLMREEPSEPLRRAAQKFLSLE
ncbi:MAG: hypothetical protein AAFU85_06085 [Planctomycetota bacterium]